MTDFIGRYYLKNTLLCDQAVHWFNQNRERAIPGHAAYIDGSIGINKDIKDSKDIVLSLEQYYEEGEFFQEIFNFLWESIQQYIKTFEELDGYRFTIDPGINFQCYTPPEGGFKLYHCERGNLSLSARCLVWMIYLNTVNDGGGTEFKYYNCVEKAEKGKLLIWPPDFTHTHRGVVSKTEEKYILTGWYRFI